MKVPIPFVWVLFAFACGGPGATQEQAAPEEGTALTATTTVLDLATYDTPLLVDLGDLATLGVDSPTVKWNEELGQLEVWAGEHFGLLITEEPGDLARLQADLDRDMLRKHTVVEQTPERFVYRSEFPDDAGTYLHFYTTIQVGERSFVVTDMEQHRYNEADVRRMVNAVKAKPAV